ncbi:hypothetical protein [Afipia carboxidovorans]|uniref:hypothetical protein n=1 Tax=Afipia carboxidovorans TaxID=40137 RepID=UPI003088A36F|nr:hypothetical protein CRBSH125_22200 [Afipia carboxidovorans]
MRKALAVAILALGIVPAHADDPAGCDGFKWSVTRERALLTSSELPTLNSGVDATTLPPLGATLNLQPAATAKLPKLPERTQKSGTHAGYLQLGQIPAGVYTVSISSYAWIDVVQDGAYVKPMALSGATGCDGIRRAIKFNLAAGLTTVQVSGVDAATIRIAVIPSSN